MQKEKEGAESNVCFKKIKDRQITTALMIIGILLVMVGRARVARLNCDWTDLT